jgi:hypothetical protein
MADSETKEVRIIGRAELQRACQLAEQTGRIGEAFVLPYLTVLKTEGIIRDFEWVSDPYARAPYDFLIAQTSGAEVAVCVKSTSEEFERPIHISSNELTEMAGAVRRYDLYRVFAIEKNTAKLRIMENVSAFAAAIRQPLGAIPGGSEVDGVSVDPAALPFGEVFNLTIRDEE